MTSTNPFVAAVEEHVAVLLDQVDAQNQDRGIEEPIRVLICVPQSLSLLSAVVTAADLATHVLIPDPNVGHYRTLDGKHVAIAGSYVVSKLGFEEPRTIRILMTEESAQLSTARFQCVLVHTNRPLVGGVYVPEDLGEMDSPTFHRYVAMIRAHPESELVFASLDAFVDDVNAASTPQKYLKASAIRQVWQASVDLLDEQPSGPHGRLQLEQTVESYILAQLHRDIFAMLVHRNQAKQCQLDDLLHPLRHATPVDFGILPAFQCEQKDAVELILDAGKQSTPLQMLMQLKRALTSLNDQINRHVVRRRHRMTASNRAKGAQNLVLGTDDVLDQLLYVLVQVSKRRPSFPLVAILTYIEEFHLVNSAVSALGFTLATYQVGVEWFFTRSIQVALPRLELPQLSPPSATDSPSTTTPPQLQIFRGNQAQSPPLPLLDAAESIAQVVCGTRSYYYVNDSGAAFAWGDARGGRLGLHRDHERNYVELPQRIPKLMHVTQLACGGFHVLACDLHGHVYAWGSNGHGQLGIGLETAAVMEPTPVTELFGVYVSAVACGDAHALALSSSGQVFSWGSNRYDQLGRPDVDNEFPRLIEQDWGGRTLENARRVDKSLGEDSNEPGVALRVAAGKFHSMAISRDGALFTWGCGQDGQLGHGSYMDLSSPQQVMSLAAVDAVDVGGGAAYTCVLLKSGHVVSCGQIDSKIDGEMPSPVVFEPMEDVHEPCVGLSCGETHYALVTSSHRVVLVARDRFDADFDGETKSQVRASFHTFDLVVEQVSCGDRGYTLFLARPCQ
ncbi:hypothetical protein AC1031_020482 [Aphanomyces cochlioides]|nr:hypothetical protein AC1031_020482 [Aphanomyces cochlioides]